MDINNMKQNHPELIVWDIMRWIEKFDQGLQKSGVRFILKMRGINKWLRIRRLLIQLKVQWLNRINELELQAYELKNEGNIWRCIGAFRKANKCFKKCERLKGERIGIIKCRQQVRALCHSPRDVDFPDYLKFPDSCKLPNDFPEMPNKRWFWFHDGIKKRVRASPTATQGKQGKQNKNIKF